ncbi:MAG TPA: dTDP-glucose 4,6-dehydratase, partial [Acidimicrobiales bacterium]|nr:dTDP-glucose 4,6-dehydratase [Acidimicrobiales bacterium]
PPPVARSDRAGKVRGMKLFVPGAAGFIGSNYVRHVVATSDDEVTAFDALTYAGNTSTLVDLEAHGSRFRFVRGDICDLPALEAAMAGHDAVVHFAAESHVDRSITGAHDFVQTNCVGTNMVMHAARTLEIPRVLHVSTDEVYGSVTEGSSKEDDPLDPRSPYSASKAGSDLIALSYFSTFGLPVMVTRSSNNFGPFQYPEKAIPLFVTNLLDARKVPLYGDGLNIRDWCYVDDNCAAVDLVVRTGEVGQIYNIGGGNEVPNRELTGRLLSLLGVGEEMIDHVPDRLGHDRRYSVDTSKVAALGWKPTRSLDEALAATVEWYRSNRWWWEPLRG